MRFTLYPIYWVNDGRVGREAFDHALLPFDITENVRIESLADKFRPGTFALGADRHGMDIREQLEDVTYALVHRYDPAAIPENGEFRGEVEFGKDSEMLVRALMACLRLIRPMRARALVMRGTIRNDDDTFDVTSYDVPPLHLLEVPEVQRLFKLRNQDCYDLRRYAPDFLGVMKGEVSKFRMAVQFHDLGHFQCLDWKARYLLWASAIESIFTTHNREHKGTVVATERIKWFLGADTSIYPPGELSEFDTDPHITVGEVLQALYNVRNHLAHGDRIPDLYFSQAARNGLNGEVNALDMLIETASFIVRSSLLRILREGLTEHFANAGRAEAFFDANNLTWSKIRARRSAAIAASRRP